jgi:hypothetical protein
MYSYCSIGPKLHFCIEYLYKYFSYLCIYDLYGPRAHALPLAQVMDAARIKSIVHRAV